MLRRCRLHGDRHRRPRGAGKSTVARAVAEALGFTYLDSGAMYRCLALAALRSGLDPEDGEALGELARQVSIELGTEFVRLDGEEVGRAIRSPEVTTAASRVSVHQQVREAMVAQQRRLIATSDYVAEGRDIGTVVSPEAPLKVYLTASEAERARRRAAEGGEEAVAVLEAMRARDRSDSERSHGALRAAADAVELDTTGMEIDAVVAEVVELARKRGLAQ